MPAVLIPLLLSCAPAVADPCAGWSAPAAAGGVRSAELVEASGLAASQRQPGSFWSHNDAGDGARLFAIGPDGADRGQLRLLDQAGQPLEAQDFEDIAIGPGPGGAPWLTVADSGNNKGKRASLRLLRFAEPAAMDGPQQVQAAVIELAWPDAPHDAEALLHDPLSGGLFILSKEKGSARIFQVEELTGAAPRLRALGELRLPDGERLTGADISPDGRRILLRTKASVLLASRAEGQTVPQALSGPLCALPAPVEEQGEAVAATATGFVTVSEGVHPSLFVVRAP